MFDVETTSPLDDRWEERDAMMYHVAGQPHHTSATMKLRTNVWRVGTFEEASRLRYKLAKIKDVTAVLHETVSQR